MSIPVIEQAKIQARVLVPLVKALQAELGEERANAIVQTALGTCTMQGAGHCDFRYAVKKAAQRP